MYLIAGLGNPTKQYEKTRHNMGFDTMDLLASKLGVSFGKSLFSALMAQCFIGGEKAILIKPQTYMNLSGDAVSSVMHFYRITPDKLIVVYDDTDLDTGALRIRKSGSAGGHNGMKNIIERIGTQEFCRVRVGIGKRPEHMEMVDFVLGRFSSEDRKKVDDAISRAADAVQDIVTNGADHAMNNYN